MSVIGGVAAACVVAALVISGVDRSASVMGMGAFGITEKPAERTELVRVFTSLREVTAGQKPKRRKAKALGALAPLTRVVPRGHTPGLSLPQRHLIRRVRCPGRPGG